MSPREVVEVEDRVWRLLGRAARYRFLASAFAYPEEAILAELGEAERWREFPEDPPAVVAAVAAVREACERVTIPALQEEHVSLFGRQVQCPPYETSYGDGRRMGGKPLELADLSGFYTAFGLEPSRVNPEMPDHVSVELEFMGVLCLKEAYALFHGLSEQEAVTREAARRFLEAHLARWVGPFSEGVGARAAHAFYRSVAALLREFVMAECRALGVAPSPSGPPLAPEPEDIGCPFGGSCPA